MEDEIVLEREAPNIMKLDPDEEAFLNEIEIKPHPKKIRRPKTFKRPRMPEYMEEQVDEDMGAFTNPNKASAQPPPPPEVVDYGDDDQEEVGDEYSDNMSVTRGGGGGEQPSEGYATIEDEKADILNKLTRLEKKGFKVNKRLSIYSNIQELRTELKRVMYTIEVDQSIKFSRRMLVACVTGVEFLNKRYNPFDIQLEGWSESVMENVDDYDGVFEELYNKYKTSVKVAPEIKLIMMLGGSAMMFHLTNSMFKSAIPNMNDVIKQNPNLVQNMMDAVKSTQARNAQAPPQDPTQRPTQTQTQTQSNSGGRYEMQGPGLDISSLMGGIMMPPPPPMNTTQTKLETLNENEDDAESVSDIVSISGGSTGGETKDVSLKPGKKSRSKSKKNEINL